MCPKTGSMGRFGGPHAPGKQQVRVPNLDCPKLVSEANI